MLVSWVLFPLLLGSSRSGAVCCSDRVVGRPAAGRDRLAAGLAVVVVASTSRLSPTPRPSSRCRSSSRSRSSASLCRLPWRGVDRSRRWAVAAAIGVFAVFAAPVVLSGEATFTGYIKLDDTATWLAITDRIMEHGRDLGGLPRSSYEATLAFNLARRLPDRGLLPLGVGHALIGQDSAWLFQPYMAFLAGDARARPSTRWSRRSCARRPLRALAASVVEPGRAPLRLLRCGAGSRRSRRHGPSA